MGTSNIKNIKLKNFHAASEIRIHINYCDPFKSAFFCQMDLSRLHNKSNIEKWNWNILDHWIITK